MVEIGKPKCYSIRIPKSGTGDGLIYTPDTFLNLRNWGAYNDVFSGKYAIDHSVDAVKGALKSKEW